MTQEYLLDDEGAEVERLPIEQAAEMLGADVRALLAENTED